MTSSNACYYWKDSSSAGKKFQCLQPTPARHSSFCRDSASTLRVFLEFCSFFLHSRCMCLNVFLQERVGLIEYRRKYEIWLYFYHFYLRTQAQRAVCHESQCAETLFMDHKSASHCLKFTFPTQVLAWRCSLQMKMAYL